MSTAGMANPTMTTSSSLPSGSTPTSTSTSSPGTLGSAATSTTMAAIQEAVKSIVTTATSAITSITGSTTTTTTTTTTAIPLKSSTTTTTTTSAVASSPSDTTTPEMMDVDDLSHSLQHFGYTDYFVFILMLVVSALIGFYFGFIEKKKKKRNMAERRGSEALDYLVGGRKMKVFPVSMSLVASFVSGISLLGTSTEIYVYGTQYAFILVTLVLSGIISWYVFLPVFCNLQLTSTYEYFEMRFDKSIRLFGSVLFTIGTIFWLPIVIYVPALAFNQVTGINIHIITPVVCVVCIFYTCVGGLKAVIWTDVLQTVIMVGAIILVIIKGTIDVGGLGVVWQRNYESGRIEAPIMTWDPTVRISMFSVFVGATFFYTQVTAGNQVIMQRYLSVSSIREAKQALILFTIGVILLTGACLFNGLLIFARYHDCDPLTTRLAKAKDQLVPLLVMDILGVYPGMPGLFVAGVFSAALSSLSTGLNSLSAVFLEDYIKPIKKEPLTEWQTALIMRASVVIIGIVCVGLVFVVERMGTVVQLSMTLGSITCGPLFGLFLMGLLVPWINGRSALCGSIISFSIMAWICIKGQLALAAKELIYPEKSVTTEGCDYYFEPLPTSAANATLLMEEGTKNWTQYIYHMSFMFYVSVGTVLTIVFSTLATFICGRNEPSKMDIALLAPFVRKLVKPSDYTSVEMKEHTVILDFETKEPLKS